MPDEEVPLALLDQSKSSVLLWENPHNPESKLQKTVARAGVGVVVEGAGVEGVVVNERGIASGGYAANKKHPINIIILLFVIYEHYAF